MNIKTNYWHNDNTTIESEADKTAIHKQMWCWDSAPENAKFLFVAYKSNKQGRIFKFSCYNGPVFVGNFRNISKTKP